MTFGTVEIIIETIIKIFHKNIISTENTKVKVVSQ